VPLGPAAATYLPNGSLPLGQLQRVTLQRNITPEIETVGYQERICTSSPGGKDPEEIYATEGEMRHGVRGSMLEDRYETLRGASSIARLLTRDSLRRSAEGGLKKAAAHPARVLQALRMRDGTLGGEEYGPQGFGKPKAV